MMTITGKNGRRFSRPFFLNMILILAGVLLILAVALFLSPPKTGLEIVDQEETVLKRIPDISSFALKHTHSAMQAPVKDYYEFKDRNTIVQTKTKYKTLGAGLPFEGVGEFRKEDEWFVKDHMTLEISDLTVRIGEVSNHVLIIDEEEVPLIDLVEKNGKALKIKPRYIIFSKFWI